MPDLRTCPLMQTIRTGTGVRMLPSVHVRVARGDWRAHLLADFTFTPDGMTTYVTDEPRVAAPLGAPDGRVDRGLGAGVPPVRLDDPGRLRSPRRGL